MSLALYPVILAGGSGTRLWPLSRKNYPKQFLCLQGEHSLLQQTLHRTQQLPCKQALIISNEAHYFLCQEQLQNQAQLQLHYLLEPCPRNTAPAIALAAQHILATQGPDTVMLILPSDHWIAEDKAWAEAMLLGCEQAQQEKTIVTFGITPQEPKTGYGYIQAGQEIKANIFQVSQFVEKPSLEKAQQMLDQGHFSWNSGMFACRVDVYLAELAKHAADIANTCKQAYQSANKQHDFTRIDLESFNLCRSESIDYAIMEKTDKAQVTPLNIQWSDLGCWTSVAQASELDEQGNSIQGQVISKNSQDCLISTTGPLVTTIGIQNQIIVATPDAILVADKAYSQQVKDIVNSLSEPHRQLADDHLRVSRPWGYFEILAEGVDFKVKRLMVKPGAKLSLQKHQHRAEHWVVVGGEAEVVNDDKQFMLQINQSTYIPPKTLHRLSNPGQEPLYVIEVQSGAYLGEDDIQRFDDVYARAVMA